LAGLERREDLTIDCVDVGRHVERLLREQRYVGHAKRSLVVMHAIHELSNGAWHIPWERQFEQVVSVRLKVFTQSTGERGFPHAVRALKHEETTWK
jgi:hypothetical protein